MFLFFTLSLCIQQKLYMVKHRDQSEPAKIIDNKPVRVEEKAGRKFWCSCGKSAKHPYCDGAHKGTGIRPVRVIFEEDQEVYWCACKQTKTPPFCDGSHKDVFFEKESE